jgi:hypothetical protein
VSRGAIYRGETAESRLTGRQGVVSIASYSKCIFLQHNVDLLVHLFGRIAQLVRALPLQGRGHRFDPCSAYHVFGPTEFLGPSFSLV